LRETACAVGADIEEEIAAARGGGGEQADDVARRFEILIGADEAP
jgi:hypothetical protein